MTKPGPVLQRQPAQDTSNSTAGTGRSEHWSRVAWSRSKPKRPVRLAEKEGPSWASGPSGRRNSSLGVAGLQAEQLGQSVSLDRVKCRARFAREASAIGGLRRSPAANRFPRLPGFSRKGTGRASALAAPLGCEFAGRMLRRVTSCCLDAEARVRFKKGVWSNLRHDQTSRCPSLPAPLIGYRSGSIGF